MKGKIKVLIRRSHLLSVLYTMYTMLRNRNDQELEETIRLFMPQVDKKTARKVKADILYNRNRYEIAYNEFFLFHFSDLSDAGKRKYVGHFEHNRICSRLFSVASRSKIKDKYGAFQTFREYYRRDVIRVGGAGDKEEFQHFCVAHPSFIVKEQYGQLGKGTFVVNLREGDSLDALFDQILAKGECVLEELIEQDADMAAFHPSSVNTIRFATFLAPEGLQKMYALLRIGCGGSVVDNAGAGGICASIDLDTGIVKTRGYREDGTVYLYHPDTGKQIIGTQIPRWEQLNRLVEEMVQVVPEQRFLGWDLALSTNGWVMVEANTKAMFTGYQMCERKGIREIMDRTFIKYLASIGQSLS